MRDKDKCTHSIWSLRPDVTRCDGSKSQSQPLHCKKKKKNTHKLLCCDLSQIDITVDHEEDNFNTSMKTSK